MDDVGGNMLETRTPTGLLQPGESKMLRIHWDTVYATSEHLFSVTMEKANCPTLEYWKVEPGVILAKVKAYIEPCEGVVICRARE